MFYLENLIGNQNTFYKSQTSLVLYGSFTNIINILVSVSYMKNCFNHMSISYIYHMAI